MIRKQLFVFNPFQENTILVYDETGECLIVDAGCMGPEEEGKMDRFIRDHSLHPVGLLCTHCHVDHILGNHFVHRQYGLLARIHPDELFLLEGAAGHAEIFGMKIPDPPAPGEFIGEGDKIRFGNSVLEVIHVPGHSPGGLAFHAREDGFLLAGDVLFRGGIGRTDLPGGDSQTLLGAIREKLFQLDEETEVIPGHGPSTTIGEEKRSNPFFL